MLDRRLCHHSWILDFAFLKMYPAKACSLFQLDFWTENVTPSFKATCSNCTTVLRAAPSLVPGHLDSNLKCSLRKKALKVVNPSLMAFDSFLVLLMCLEFIIINEFGLWLNDRALT